MKFYYYEGKANICGARVRQARKRLNLSQEMLAARMQMRKINLTQRCISRIERQHRIVADFELRALADALEVDPLWLMNG